MPSFIICTHLIPFKNLSSTSHFIILSFLDNIFTLGILTFLMEKKLHMSTVKFINDAFYILINNATIYYYILREILS